MVAHEKLKILVPVDGSYPGTTTLRAITPLIRSNPVECTLLHVAETGEAPEEIRENLREHREALEDLGVDVRVFFAAGRPAGEILRLGEGGEFDLIAMPTHGRKGMDRLLMGSVAEEVVRSAPVPTLLWRQGLDASAWDHIVVALNGAPGAEEVLEDVTFLARRMGAKVHLVQVGLNLLRSNAYRGVPLEFPAPEPTGYLEEVAGKLAAEGIAVTTEHRAGMAAMEIAHYAREIDAGLICMTTEGRRETLPGLDRSVAAEVIRQAPCPVYVRRMHRHACRKA